MLIVIVVSVVVVVVVVVAVVCIVVVIVVVIMDVAISFGEDQHRVTSVIIINLAAIMNCEELVDDGTFTHSI